MVANKFPVNSAAVNGISQIGVTFVYPVSPAVTCSWRAQQHADMIAEDGEPGIMRTLDGNTVQIIVAIKGLKAVSGGSPQQVRLKRGYISTCALAKRGFTGRIKTGFALDVDDTTWHVAAAFLQKVKGERVRWVLDLAESGVS